MRSGEVVCAYGIFIQLPEGYEAQIRGRSGWRCVHGVMLVNGIGTIDSDYRGEIKVIMTTCKAEPTRFAKESVLHRWCSANWWRRQFELTDSLRSPCAIKAVLALRESSVRNKVKGSVFPWKL